MYTHILKRSYLALLSLLFFQQAFAIDLVVIDAGPTGTYGSIGSAITAANNGDRIIITNKASTAPWTENLTINKSLTFVSATDNVRFKLQGTITIQPANGREVTIIGLESIGGIVQGTANVSATRTTVNILGSSFNYSGTAIDFDFDNYDLTVANCDLGTTASIEFNYGKILGNQARLIYKRNSTIVTSDKVQIIGNKCTTIRADGRDAILEIKNNFISTSSNINFYSILVNDLRSGNHSIANNTIQMAGSTYGIDVNTVSVGAVLIVNNNVIRQISTTSNDYAFRVRLNSGSIITEFNYIRSGSGLLTSTGIQLSSTDIFTTTINIDGDGRNLAGSPAIDGSNPSILYYDLNLTRGDAGAYGGSFTLDNYFPLTTGSSRVYHVIMDRGVFQGYNLDVKALGFDR